MAYFSNGTEGMVYEDTYCATCVHYDDCSVLAAHELYQGDPNPPGDIQQQILDLFIPRDGVENQKCTMHHTQE